MVAPLVYAGVAVATQVAAGLIGQAQAAKDRKEQKKLYEAAAAEIAKVLPPNPEDQAVMLEQFKQAGVLTPETTQYLGDIQSSMEGVSTDPRLKEAQYSALAKMQQVGKEGLTFEDKLALQDINNQQGQIERGQRQAILQNMAARGMGGSGAELAANLAAQQGSAGTRSRESMAVAAQAQKRALEAMMQSGQMAGSMRNQDFGEQAQKAAAIDAIKRFNMANRYDVQNQNVGIRNNAQAANLSNKQDVMNRNTGVANQQETHNKGLAQQGYDNELQKAGMMANAKQGLANAAGQRAQATANQWAQGGAAVGQGINAYTQYQQRQEDRDSLKQLLSDRQNAGASPEELAMIYKRQEGSV